MTKDAIVWALERASAELEKAFDEANTLNLLHGAARVRSLIPTLPQEWEQRKAAMQVSAHRILQETISAANTQNEEAPETANVPEGYTVGEVAAAPTSEPAGGMPEPLETFHCDCGANDHLPRFIYTQDDYEQLQERVRELENSEPDLVLREIGHQVGAKEGEHILDAVCRLVERAAALEEYAERYRWLRNSSADQYEHPIVVSQTRSEVGMRYVGPVLGNGLDAAIDAARAANGQDGEEKG